MIPSTLNSNFQNFLCNTLTSLTETQKRENHPCDISLVYLFWPRLHEWTSFVCVLPVCWLCWAFLGIFTLIIENWSSLALTVAESDWKVGGLLSCYKDPVSVSGSNNIEIWVLLLFGKEICYVLSVPMFTLWGRLKGLYQYLDHLRTLPLWSHHKARRGSKCLHYFSLSGIC